MTALLAPIRAAVFFIYALFFVTYLAFSEWLYDRRDTARTDADASE